MMDQKTGGRGTGIGHFAPPAWRAITCQLLGPASGISVGPVSGMSSLQALSLAGAHRVRRLMSVNIDLVGLVGLCIWVV